MNENEINKNQREENNSNDKMDDISGELRKKKERKQLRSKEKKNAKEKLSKATKTKESKIESKSPRMLVLLKKTFKDIYSPIKFIIFLGIMLIAPVLMIIMSSSAKYDSVSVVQSVGGIAMSGVFWVFFVTLGLAFIVIIGMTGAPLISDEVSSGTMLILVSKPISRLKIFLGKYLACFLHGAILSLAAIFLIGWISVLLTSMNPAHFISLIPYLIALYIYSLFILFIFVSITLALSSIFKKARTTSLIVVALALFAFVAFFMIRQFGSQYYKLYMLYHFDLGYHLANVFTWILEIFDAIPQVSSWQYFFATFTNVYDTASASDSDQNIILGGYEKQPYYTPVLSLLVWLGIAAILLAFALFNLKKREISN